MTSLQLALTNSDFGSAREIGVVAEISRRDEAGRIVPGELRRVTVTTYEPTTIFDINPGNWEVRVFTSGGGIVSRDVTVGPGAEGRVQLDIPGRRRPGGTTPNRALSTNTFNKRAGFGGSGFQVFVPAGLQSISVEAGHLGQGDPIWGNWQLLADWISKKANPLLLESFPVGPTGNSPEAPRELSAPSSYPARARTFAIAKSRGRRRTHFVPTPWRNHSEPRHALIEIMNGPTAEWTTHVRVDDPLYAGLIAYLASGAASTAVEMIESSGADIFGDYARGSDSQDLLRDKKSSPLGACVAAYVLVASVARADAMPWRPWITNLSNWFEWLPDGAIIEARCRVLAARSQAELDDCLPLVRGAIARGIPSYTLGIGWLLQLMVHFDNDEFIKSAISLIGEVASKLDMGEAFTTLDFE